MATPIVVNALVEKYREIAGRWKAAQLEADRCRADMVRLEATIRLFDADCRLAGVKPKMPRRPKPPSYRKGRYVHQAFEILEQSAEPLSAREVALRIIKDRNMMADTRTIKTMTNAIRASFDRHNGTLLVVDKSGFPHRWTMDRSDLD